MEFRLHNSSSVYFSEQLTEGPVTLEVKDAYIESPAASLVRKLSGFEKEYWEDYDIADYVWLVADDTLPVLVQNYLINYHRALALTILQKKSVTVESLKKILNIVLGKPFTILEGEIIVESANDPNFFMVHQYVNGELAISYKLSKVYFAAFEYATGDTLPAYTPLIGTTIEINEALRDKTWLATYDPLDSVPLQRPSGASGQSTDYDLNINRVIAVENIVNTSILYSNPQFRYSGLFLQKVLERILKKDIIFLFKESISE
jgi:hypothetical protein